jgi:hypothetical protein
MSASGITIKKLRLLIGGDALYRVYPHAGPFACNAFTFLVSGFTVKQCSSKKSPPLAPITLHRHIIFPISFAPLHFTTQRQLVPHPPLNSATPTIQNRAVASTSFHPIRNKEFQEKWYLLGCNAIHSGSSPTFRRNVLPPSSGSKMTPSKKTVSSSWWQ